MLGVQAIDDSVWCFDDIEFDIFRGINFWMNILVVYGANCCTYKHQRMFATWAGIRDLDTGEWGGFEVWAAVQI